jgi:hypothetical protein
MLVSLGLLPAASSRTSKTPVNLRLLLSRNTRKVQAMHMAQANDSIRPGALLRVGRLIGSNKLRNLVTPGLLGWASGRPFFVRVIPEIKSLEITLKISSERSTGL